MLSFAEHVVDIPVGNPPGLELQQETLGRRRISVLFKMGIDERIFLSESVVQGSDRRRIKAEYRSQRAFLFGAGQDLIASGRKGITFRLSLFLRFQQSGAWLSSRSARGKCTKTESNEQRHLPST